MSLKQKLILALTAYAVLAFLVWQTLSDDPIGVGANFHIGLRTLTLVILGLFAFRTVMMWKRQQIDDTRENDRRS